MFGVVVVFGFVVVGLYSMWLVRACRCWFALGVVGCCFGVCVFVIDWLLGVVVGLRLLLLVSV